MKPYIIGISGISGSGKSTFAANLKTKCGDFYAGDVVIINLDGFYRSINEDDMCLVKAGEYNFDHPYAIDLDHARRCISAIADGHLVAVPIYDFEKKKCVGHYEVNNPRVVIVEGIHALHSKLFPLYDITAFLEVPMSVALSRRAVRDNKERGRTPEDTAEMFRKFVLPMYKLHVEPNVKKAAILVNGLNTGVHINMLYEHIKPLLIHPRF
ncbi:NS10 protein [Bottlenose dolphin coronavirus]|nr:NS10 protein [Bottlenose dolphin coronavirus]QII89044.1 NS10 protein [Bottlenose dolphin coronavirus]QII89058.1 NS10 protein [Bottlenose dolphin coronavirus]QII89072.1 NS10 protein [Bottlenose dolphin coronavirus]